MGYFMASKNSYAGINAIIAKNIKHHAKSIKRSSAFIHEYIEDIEQDLLLDCLPCLAKYDERSEHYKAYVSQLIQSRAANLRKKYLCKKRAIDFVDSDALGEEDKSFEHNFAARIDVNAAIAKSPSEQQEICKLLMEHNFNISEVSRRMGIPRSTLHDTLKKLGEDKHFTNLKIYLPAQAF